MTFQRLGGLAALTCAGTYLVGFALLVTLLAPLGYGTSEIDAAAVVAFIDARPGIFTAWNVTIYVINALALALLAAALSRGMADRAPDWAAAAQGFGLIWAALVLGAGMIANVAAERAALLFPVDPATAAEGWAMLHAVELGLGGGNEIAGGVWIACASLGALAARRLARWTCWLGLAVGASGLATILPALGDSAGALFGLGAIAWFIAVGATMTLERDAAAGARGQLAV